MDKRANVAAAASGTREGRMIEYIDHLHEHFIAPCTIRDAAYMPPTKSSFSVEMKPETLARFRFQSMGAG